MGETWKPVPGYEGLYEVSDIGRVRRIERRVLTPHAGNGGYLRVLLCNRHQKHVGIHRLVAGAFIGACPPGYVVNHKDGDPANNAPSNLEYVTQSQNVRHAFETLGRQPPHRGESTHFAKLTDNDVIQIRRRRVEGQTYKQIAKDFNTKPANVWHICVGHTWKHLL